MRIIDGVEAEEGLIHGSDLDVDRRGWYRLPVHRQPGGTSTGDFTLGWEYEALYVNDLHGLIVEIVAYIGYDGADPESCYAAERIGGGTIDSEGDIDITDYDHDTIDCAIQADVVDWDSVVRSHALVDIRDALVTPEMTRDEEVAEAIEVKKQIHRTLQRKK